jgi:hypothetical protein
MPQEQAKGNLMGFLHALRTNINDVKNDVKVFGPRILLRHLAWVTGAATIPVNIPGVGLIYVRLGDSDLLVVRQIFKSREYDIGTHVPAVELLNARYQAILSAGHKPVVVDAGANIGAAALWFCTKYSNAAVVAVEPEPGNVMVLERNLMMT